MLSPDKCSGLPGSNRNRHLVDRKGIEPFRSSLQDSTPHQRTTRKLFSYQKKNPPCFCEPEGANVHARRLGSGVQLRCFEVQCIHRHHVPYRIILLQALVAGIEPT